MRYSNIEPDQEIRAAPRVTGVAARPSRNQCRAGMSPLAIAKKLASRASDAKKVVAIGIQSGFGNEKSDREQLALRVEEKAKLHRHRHRAEGVLQDEQPRLPGSGGPAERLVIRTMRLDSGQARLRPI